VVARVPAASGTKQRPAGYVVVNANLESLRAQLEDIAVRRFGGKDISLLIATQDGQVVASFGVQGVSPGSHVGGLPIWAVLPKNMTAKKADFVSEHVDSGTPMVGALETVPTLGWAVAIWRPKAVAYASITEMRRNGVAVAAGAALLSLLVALFAARSVTAPILELVGVSRLIGQRRWREVSLGSPRSDEIGELSRSLEQMSSDLEKGEGEIARQAKLRGDLGRFLSKPLVDAIVRGDHPLALGGKRAPVSILFADVVGFTPLTEARDAEQIVKLLNELFSVLSEIVFRHEGTVDKFIGDCLMAVWGAPVPQEDHAARALAAAEDMMRFLETANEEWKEKYDVEIRLGIGVNSGEAIVGNIGSDKRMEYTVIGDVVNVAARLEAIAAPDQVLVAETTKELVGARFVLRRLGARRLTGRKNETEVYALEME
jgi:adenylate cyclase